LFATRAARGSKLFGGGAMDGLRDLKFMNPATDFTVGGAVKPLAKSVY
jgi:hypothetical protein